MALEVKKGAKLPRLVGVENPKEHQSEPPQKVETLTAPFDETLKGLRQKINDVELDAERLFLQKNEFDDFREEYREDMREIKSLISRG